MTMDGIRLIMISNVSFENCRAWKKGKSIAEGIFFFFAVGEPRYLPVKQNGRRRDIMIICRQRVTRDGYCWPDGLRWGRGGG